MNEAAADITALLFHLKNCPADFLKATVNTNALLMDVYRNVFGSKAAPDTQLPQLRANEDFDKNHLLSIQIGCWLFSHASFAGGKNVLQGMESFLFGVLAGLMPYVDHKDWIHDEDRSEEFIRLALASCNLMPGGESEAEAVDRLDALSTLKRRNVLQESNAAMQRIKEIRQKMAEAKAREAANVYGRE